MKRLFFAALMLAGLGLSACGGNSGAELAIATSTPTLTAIPTATPSATPKPALGEGLLPGFVVTD